MLVECPKCSAVVTVRMTGAHSWNTRYPDAFAMKCDTVRGKLEKRGHLEGPDVIECPHLEEAIGVAISGRSRRRR